MRLTVRRVLVSPRVFLVAVRLSFDASLRIEAFRLIRVSTQRRARTGDFGTSAADAPTGVSAKLSTYYLPNEIRRTHDGVLLAIPDPHLRAAFGTQTPEMIARTLFDPAPRVPWARFLTNPWTPKPSERRR